MYFKISDETFYKYYDTSNICFKHRNINILFEGESGYEKVSHSFKFCNISHNLLKKKEN